MIVSVIALELGRKRVVVRELLEEIDGASLPRLEKTGFQNVYFEDSDVPSHSLAQRILVGLDGFKPGHIDSMILVSSYFPNAPSGAQELAEIIGLSSGVDIYAIQDACTGYLTALALAESLIRSRSATEVLIVTFDTYSKYTDGDIGLKMLFSDAMTFTTVSEKLPMSHVSQTPLSLKSVAKASQRKPQSRDALKVEEGKLTMRGSAVFQFVIESVPKLIQEALDGIDEEQSSVDWFLHQGSKFVVEQLSSSLGASGEELFRSSDYGNTVSGSIPFQLYRHVPNKEFIGLVGFGMGLSAKVGIYRVEHL